MRYILILLIVLASSCKKKNEFRDVIETHLQTDRKVSVLLVDTVFFKEELSREYKEIGDMFTNHIRKGNDRNDSLGIEMQRYSNELIAAKRDSPDYVVGFRVLASVGGDDFEFLIDPDKKRVEIQD